MEKKDYLVDVPVKIGCFIRPELFEKTFESVKKARPSRLFIQSDGPRKNRPEEEELVRRCREIVSDENIDWKCEVTRIYFDENQGLYSASRQTSRIIFDKVDRCIMLEEDNLLDPSYFAYCAELLERYRDDLRIARICSYNCLGENPDCRADYFFSRGGAIHACAIWKRTYEAYDREFKYGKDSYTYSLIYKNSPWIMKKRLEGYLKNPDYEGHPAGAEFFMKLATFGNNQLNIIPKRNFLCNTGVGGGSAHSTDSLKKLPKRLRKHFFAKTYECSFPLKHPDYIIEDPSYIKAELHSIGKSGPFEKAVMSFSQAARLLLYGDTAKLTGAVKKRVNKTVEK